MNIVCVCVCVCVCVSEEEREGEINLLFVNIEQDRVQGVH